MMHQITVVILESTLQSLSCNLGVSVAFESIALFALINIKTYFI